MTKLLNKSCKSLWKLVRNGCGKFLDSPPNIRAGFKFHLRKNRGSTACSARLSASGIRRKKCTCAYFAALVNKKRQIKDQNGHSGYEQQAVVINSFSMPQPPGDENRVQGGREQGETEKHVHLSTFRVCQQHAPVFLFARSKATKPTKCKYLERNNNKQPCSGECDSVSIFLSPIFVGMAAASLYLCSF